MILIVYSSLEKEPIYSTDEFVLSDISCSGWSEITASCSNFSNGNWIEIDKSLNISHKSECEKLCKEKGVFGCCFLHEEIGCRFSPGAHASLSIEKGVIIRGGDFIAETCYPSGIVFF